MFPLRKIVVLLVVVHLVALSNATTVGSALSTCSLSSFNGLATNILSVLNNCAKGGVSFTQDVSGNGLAFNNGLAWLQSSALTDLISAAEDADLDLTITHGMLPLPMTYALNSWADDNQCGVVSFWGSVDPGDSLFEVGAMIRIQTAWVPYFKDALEDNGWSQTSTNEVFSHSGSLSGSDGVKAFQRLYNYFASGSLDEDGDFDSSTRNALINSPAGGWGNIPSCSALGYSGTGTNSVISTNTIVAAAAGGGGGSVLLGGGIGFFVRRRYLQKKKQRESERGQGDGRALGDMKQAAPEVESSSPAPATSEGNPVFV